MRAGPEWPARIAVDWRTVLGTLASELKDLFDRSVIATLVALVVLAAAAAGMALAVLGGDDSRDNAGSALPPPAVDVRPTVDERASAPSTHTANDTGGSHGRAERDAAHNGERAQASAAPGATTESPNVSGSVPDSGAKGDQHGQQPSLPSDTGEPSGQQGTPPSLPSDTGEPGAAPAITTPSPAPIPDDGTPSG
jgi:hypothetical protein